MHKPPPGPEQSSQGIPFVMTAAMKEALRGHGLSDDEIANIRPAQAREILGRPNGGGRPPPGINGGSQSPPGPNNIPVRFLERLRPGGPWLLIAIVPDGKPTAISAHTTDQIETFVREHDGKANLYYLVNPTRTAMNKKAAKKDIAAIEYVLGDLDPASDETSEAAKARYLEQLNGTFGPKPTAGIDSGNGIQCLWKLREPIILNELVNGECSTEDQTKIEDAEARTAAVMKRLGAKAGTQNIDRILRLPGTTNLPNAKKRREGRTECPTRLLWFDDVSYPLDAFPRDDNQFGAFPEGQLRDETGSGYGFRFMQECHARGLSYEQARVAILADTTNAGEWANRVDERQLRRAWGNGQPGAAPPYSEEALALTFAERHASTLRYVAEWDQWLIWDGTCWRMDRTRQVFTLARELCRETAAEVKKLCERQRIASAKTRAAVVSLAGEDRRLAATTEQWDADPWLLNTPDGVVDLHTGRLREHRTTDYMTKQTAAPPKGECPRWMSFLQEITGGDEALQRYLQRLSGYCLTGVTNEQELFFFYGSGNNGKGVWVQTVSGVLQDYHCSTSIETFTVAKSERHPTELAGLRGARLVTASETEEGRRWAEARIKELTGGDKISARFMRQDFFEYVPQFKLVLLGNHMPTLRTVNKAITRRFNRIPFSVTIPDERVNKHLAEDSRRSGPVSWRGQSKAAWNGNASACARQKQ
jgi:putative DNA primase/helicase